MIPDCVLGEMRATIFASPIVYDPSNLQRVTSVLKPGEGYMPNVEPPAFVNTPFPFQVPQPNQTIPLDWGMVSQKTNFRVHFGPQKIDVPKSTHTASPTLEEDCSNLRRSIYQK